MSSKDETMKTKCIKWQGIDLNIFVGANFCGKSTVLELIRRCMTDEINVSVTRSWDETKVAYAFCQFDTIHYKEIDHGNCSDGVPESVVFLVITCNSVRNKHHRENSDFCCMAIVLVIEFCNYD